MRKICFILFFNLIILAAFAQKNSVKQYYGKYEVKLKSDNTYLIRDRFCWNFGEYKWSGDTIFFNVIPIYDTIRIIEPDSSRLELVLSEDLNSSFIGEIRKFRAIFSFDKEKGTFNVSTPEPESTLPKIIISGQAKAFPEYLIKKRNMLGLYNDKGNFEWLLKLKPD